MAAAVHHSGAGLPPAPSAQGEVARGLACSGGGRREPPAILLLNGELKHQDMWLGEYARTGREAHGWPVWEHESGHVWLARTGKGTWAVQEAANIGVSSKGKLHLRDPGEDFPHEISRAVWLESDGRALVRAPGLRCSADPPPSTLVLSGDLNHHPQCLGCYTIVKGWEAHGRPVWRHESGNLCVAVTADMLWSVQEERNVGHDNRACFLKLADSCAVYPHRSKARWTEVGTGSSPEAPGLMCAADPPPAAISLFGEDGPVVGCTWLGVYTLVAGRQVRGRPVWKHVDSNRYIARLSDGTWVVQEERHVGVEACGKAHLNDRSVLFPSQSKVTWQTFESNKWIEARWLKCAATPILSDYRAGASGCSDGCSSVDSMDAVRSVRSEPSDDQARYSDDEEIPKGILKLPRQAKGALVRSISFQSQLDVSGQDEAKTLQKPQISDMSRSSSEPVSSDLSACTKMLQKPRALTRSASHDQISDLCATSAQTQQKPAALTRSASHDQISDLCASEASTTAEGDGQVHRVRRTRSNEDSADPGPPQARSNKTSASTISRLEKQYYGPRDARRMGTVAAGHPLPGTTGMNFRLSPPPISLSCLHG